MRRRWTIGLIALLCALLLAPVAFAVNDPGHDTLYVLRIGDTNVTGSINLTQNLTASFVRFTSKAFGDYLDIVANGTVLAAPSTPRIMGATSSLYIDSTGGLYLNTKGGTSSVIQVGDTATNGVTLNVSGVIRQQNVLVCLSNGTNCISGNNSGNVSTVTAGDGLANSGTDTDPILDVGAGDGISVAADSVAVDTTVCRNDGSNCPAGATTAANVTGSGTANYLPKWTNETDIGSSLLYDSGSAIGLGTTGPLARFHINDTSGQPIRITSTQVSTYINFTNSNSRSVLFGILASTSGNNAGIRQNGDGGIALSIAGTEHVVLTNGGNLGIGTTGATQKLDVNGSINTTGNISTQQGNGVCFNPACTSRIYYNGTATVIEGT